MNSKLIIDGDKEVTIKRMFQWHTYGGLLMGLPTETDNNQILSDLKTEARDFCGFNEVYIIEPKQTPIPYDGTYPFGKPAVLPSVICMVQLWHHDTFKKNYKDFSALGLVWFQDEYAFPIDILILEKIKEIPFSQICGEFDY